MTDYSIKRGPWGKPYVTRDFAPLDWPEGARDPLNGFLYDRVSTIAENLDTKENLSPYHQCQAVTGLMIGDVGKSLAVQFKALISEFGIKAWDNAKGDVKDLLRQARNNGGEEYKSGMGSALHRYSTLIDKDREIELPERLLEPWLDCYEEAMTSRFEVLDWEGFVVCDDLENPETLADIRSAGNWDKLVRDLTTGEVMIADLKSGKDTNEWAMKPTVQVAIYAHGVRYDQETGRRWPIHDELSLTKGVLIHLPFEGKAPCCDIYPLDLVEGWRLAQMSADITASRKMRVYKKDALVRVKAA